VRTTSWPFGRRIRTFRGPPPWPHLLTIFTGLPRSRCVVLILFVEELEESAGQRGRENDQLADRRILSRGGGAFFVAAFPERVRRLQSGNRCSRRIVRARPLRPTAARALLPLGLVGRHRVQGKHLFPGGAPSSSTRPQGRRGRRRVSPYRAARCWPSAAALCSGRRASQSGVRWLPRVWRSGAAKDRQARLRRDRRKGSLST